METKSNALEKSIRRVIRQKSTNSVEKKVENIGQIKT